MYRTPFFSPDIQQNPPAARCTRCGGEIYWDDELYFIEGACICTACLDGFARDYFAPFRLSICELLSSLHAEERSR